MEEKPVSTLDIMKKAIGRTEAELEKMETDLLPGLNANLSNISNAAQQLHEIALKMRGE